MSSLTVRVGPAAERGAEIDDLVLEPHDARPAPPSAGIITRPPRPTRLGCPGGHVSSRIGERRSAIGAHVSITASATTAKREQSAPFHQKQAPR
jgi:hypothetical protein